MRSFVAERALMLGEMDPFDFALAEKLGRSVEELQATVSAGELIRWRAFYVWRHGQLVHAQKEAEMRGRRI